MHQLKGIDMKLKSQDFALILLVGFFAVAHPTQADTVVEPARAETYGETFGRKFFGGLGNIFTSVAEVPKNIIIVNNQSNFVWGLAGGSFKGAVNVIGRAGVGVFDLLTSPIPTDPIVNPLYVWDDFYAETSYGPAMVDSNPK
jgi:putative exosortase-associated protein (TIGR04073 family)